LQAGKGVAVTDVSSGSPADLVGIRIGVMILLANQQDVNNNMKFKQAIDKSSDEKRVLLLVSENGISRYIVLDW